MSKAFAVLCLLAFLIATPDCLAAGATTSAIGDTREWHATRPSELDYVVIAPYCMENEIQIEVPPAKVFQILSESNWGDWFVDFQSVEWTSQPPYRVGSTRTVTLKSLAVKERFLAWDPGRRFSFSIDAISLPLLEGMMEDMQLEPRKDGSATHFRWRVFYTPNPLMAALRPIAQPLFAGMFHQSLENLKAYAEKPAP